MRGDFLIRVPAEFQEEFEEQWDSARRKENLSVAYVLTEPQPVSGFTGAEFVEWIPQILEHTPEIMAAVFGYLVSRRNVEIAFDDMKFKNLSEDKLGQVLETIRKHQFMTDTSTALAPDTDQETAARGRNRKTSRRTTGRKTSPTKTSRKASPTKTRRKTSRKKTARR